MIRRLSYQVKMLTGKYSLAYQLLRESCTMGKRDMVNGTLRFVVFSVFVLATWAEKQKDEIPELRHMNAEADPCEDFYEYTCGNFKSEHPLPEGLLTVDQFSILEEKITKLANKILASNERDEDPQALRKAKLAYQSCVDLPYIDLEVEPELSVVEEEHGFPLVQTLLHGKKPTKFGWYDIADAVSEYGIPMMFNIQAFSNLEDPTKNLIYISQLDQTYPTQIRPYVRSSYEDIIEHGFLELVDTVKFQANALNSSLQMKPFDIYLRKMSLKLRRATNSVISERELLSNLDVMSNFMRGVFSGGYIPENTDVKSLSNGTYTTLRRLNEWTKEHFGNTLKMDWVEYMRRVFSKSGIEINEDTQIMNQSTIPKLLYGILNWVNMNNDETIKSFVMMRIYLFMAVDGDSESRSILEEYLATQDVEILPRWEYCTRKIIDSVGTAGMSFAVAYEYQLHHFDVNLLGQALEMIRDLQTTYRENLQKVTWMDDATKAKAIEKLDNMITIFGYPDFVSDPNLLDQFYKNLQICSWDNYGNTKRIKAFKNAYQISQVAKRDRAFWDKSPFEVNAYYNRPNNKIIFPIAMLNPVFFGSGNRILDYGRIGSIVGHEITHGFDADGRKYDANGIMSLWWTPETLAEFENKTDCFINQYNQYYLPEINAYVNGSKTLNENLADNGGVREAYWSMKKMLERTGEDGQDGRFTPEQLFFIGFGTAWCNNPSTKYLQSMQTNEHANSKWRVNGVVSNMEEFSEAFNCPAGSKMNPSNKCRLW